MSTEPYDAVVVGSGASGAMAALTLVNRGARVLMLEAGRAYDPVTETPMFQTNEQAPLRAASTPDKPFGFYDATIGGWSIDGEPYLTASGREFRWFRSRMMGGRTNHWARHVPRFAEIDMKPSRRQPGAYDWPIGYADLAPWYDRVERIIGVCGRANGLRHHPDSPAGVIQPGPGPRITDLFVKAATDRMGIPCVPNRRAILTRSLPDGRNACFWATPCVRGCSIGAAFQTTTSLIPAALRTGRLTIRNGAMATRVLLGATGRAAGVEWRDVASLARHQTLGRVVVLGAGALDTTRILLASAQPGHDHGLANGSGQLGRNLSDSCGATLRAQFPALAGRPRYNDDGYWAGHYYLPWWLYEAQIAGKLPFATGYHIELNANSQTAPTIRMGEVTDMHHGHGPSLRQAARDWYGSVIGFDMRGETLPVSQSRMTLHPSQRDRYGLPIPVFDYRWSRHAPEMTRHFTGVVAEIVDRLGGNLITRDLDPERLMNHPGEIIHEAGTARMGRSAADSVTDSFGRTWQIDNLYLVDAATFPSNPHKNLTLTIMALAARAMDQVADRMAGGAL